MLQRNRHLLLNFQCFLRSNTIERMGKILSNFCERYIIDNLALLNFISQSKPLNVYIIDILSAPKLSLSRTGAESEEKATSVSAKISIYR